MNTAKIKPNYINPTITECSFRELIPNLSNLGIDRDKFLSMFKDFSKTVLFTLYNNNLSGNLFELTSKISSYKRVRVERNAIRNPITQIKWRARNNTKLPYIETYDAVIIPLQPTRRASHIRLAFSPEAELIVLQIRYLKDNQFISVVTDKHRFIDHLKYLC